jgi:hypothetical protein
MSACLVRSRFRGFAPLVEVLIALVLSVVLLQAASQLFSTSRIAIGVDSIETDLRSKAVDVVDQIAKDLKDSGTVGGGLASTYVSANTISFKKCTGFNTGTGTTQWGPNIEFSVQSDNRTGGIRYWLRRREGNSAPYTDTELTDKLDSATALTFDKPISGNIITIAVTLKEEDFMSYQILGTSAWPNKEYRRYWATTSVEFYNK